MWYLRFHFQSTNTIKYFRSSKPVYTPFLFPALIFTFKSQSQPWRRVSFLHIWYFLEKHNYTDSRQALEQKEWAKTNDYKSDCCSHELGLCRTKQRKLTNWNQLRSSNSCLMCISLFSFPSQLFCLIEYAFEHLLQQHDTSHQPARGPNNPFYALNWNQLLLTSRLPPSRPTHTFPNTSQSFPSIEQFLPQHGSRLPLDRQFKNRLEVCLCPEERLLLQGKSSLSGYG